MTIAALLPDPDGAYNMLAVAAHADDIEIGAGGCLMRLLDERPRLTLDVLVMTGDEAREREAEASARSLAANRLGRLGIRFLSLRDGYLPTAGARPKDELERQKDGGPYDLILCPSLLDAHQDHRVTAELVWQTFRTAPILEYEIPKYEGLREQPNLFIELSRELCERKVTHILESYPSQSGRSWFTPETFWAVLRLRGVESGSPTGYAEAFVCRKLRI